MTKAPAPRDQSWSNWSGTETCQPRRLALPRSEDALREIVVNSTGQLRFCGSGHSFTGLCATNDTLISLEEMPARVIRHSGAQAQAPQTTPASAEIECRARVQAGASLNSLSRALDDLGLGFRNLGDIDVQSLAGAAMTATHGSGAAFPCLSGELRGLRLMDAQGDIHEIDADTPGDLLNAARVSLGALGIILEADIALRPAYKLKRVAQPRRLGPLLHEAPGLWATHRNFEFFALPHCDYALSITHEETDAPDFAENPSDDMATLRQLKLVRGLTKAFPFLRRRIMNAALGRTKTETVVGQSWQLLANERSMRFHEMEYHLPENGALEAFGEIIKLIEQHAPEVFFPIEVRKTAADSGWLSPFQGAPRVSIAVHAHQADAYEWMFEKIEPVLRAYGGRPHWGKLHSLAAPELRALYPDFDRFCDLRRQFDPQGRLLNAHLAKLFGEPMP